MAWTDSRILRSMLTDALADAVQFDFSGTGVDVWKATLFDNGITPDKDASSANSCYNAGAWVSTSHEIYQAGQWAAGGVALSGTVAITNPSSGVVMFDATTDTASGTAFTTKLNDAGSAVNVFGSLVYDDDLTSPADQGACFNYFGGGSSVTAGQLTIVWHTNGLFQITV